MVCLKGKVALITGASSGIGAATAIHFASLGCDVAINGRNTTKLQRTFDECLKAGLPDTKVFLAIGDISKEEDAEAIVRNTVSHFGVLDILINNAGISIINPKFPLTDFDKIMNTNVRALFHMTQLAVPHLKKTKGNIVNVSSVVSRRVGKDMHFYSASKAAVDHLTRSTALTLAEHCIRVNSINPGGVKTDFFDTAGIEFAKIEKVLRNLHAMKRIADPIEIAKPIAFLASDDASFITGSTVLADGGCSLLPGSSK